MYPNEAEEEEEEMDEGESFVLSMNLQRSLRC